MNKDLIVGVIVLGFICMFIGVVIGSAATQTAELITERQCIDVKTKQ